MEDFKDESVLMAITHGIEFQLRKHGYYFRATNIEDAVNGLSNFELLQLITDYLESKKDTVL